MTINPAFAKEDGATKKLPDMQMSSVAKHMEAFCQKDAPATLLLVDRTTVFDEIDRKDLAEGLDLTYSSLPPGGRLIVHSIGAHVGASKRIFSACYPVCPPENGPLSWVWTQCNQKKSKKALQLFRAGLNKVLSPILADNQEYPRSSIAETMADLSRSYARLDRIGRMIVFSDMLENSDVIPVRALLSQNPKSLLSKLYLDDRKPLEGVTVHAFGFGRWHDNGRRGLSSQERRQVRAFWQSFMDLKARQFSRWIGFLLSRPAVWQEIREAMT